MNIKLAENIKKLRTECDMSQKELAGRLSVSPQAVCRWENGQAYPDIETLPHIAEIFKTSLDMLMGTGMSFLQEKHKTLSEARKRVKGKYDFAGRRQVCGILEELAAEGALQTAFLGEALALHQAGGIGLDTVERAREYCRALLIKSSGDDRIRYLKTILSIEGSQNVDRWREFVSNDSFDSCWDDLLLWRYTFGECPEPEQFEPTRQRVVRQALRKLILNLILGRTDPECRVGSLVFQTLSPPKTYRLALDILDLFSTVEGDPLPDLRIYVEIRMAAALFAEGRDEEGFATLEIIAAQIEALENSPLAPQRDAEEYTKIGQFLSEDDIRHCLAGVSFEMNRREYDRVREDSRFVALSRCVEKADKTDH